MSEGTDIETAKAHLRAARRGGFRSHSRTGFGNEFDIRVEDIEAVLDRLSEVEGLARELLVIALETNEHIGLKAAGKKTIEKARRILGEQELVTHV